MRIRLSLLTFFFLVGITTHVSAQDARFNFDPDLSYDTSIQSPAQFLGYELGSEYTFHHQLIAYFRYLADNSDKITVGTYGKTYENRDLIYAVISSSSNQQNIEAIRQANLELANPSTDTPVGDQPAIVMLSYNVHGNEGSSAEAAMQAAYRLVAATDAETRNLLDNSVTIIDPMLNPDGRDRYVYWYKSSQANMLNTDASDLEHDEIWPGGRTNHYWFDLNRDWVWLVHPESRGRIAVYQQWLPHTNLDLHEQGFNNNYFTMPGITPRNRQLPDDYEDWADTFGRGVIEEFDKHNVNYATREAFDFFYPGYGSSYPSVMGAIGMLAEQGGHSRGGRAVETNDGYVLTLRQRIFDHYTNSISTVRTAVNNRVALLEYFKKAFTTETKKGKETAYILPDNPNDYTYHVINILLQHNVEVERATESFNTQAFNYWDGTSSRTSYDSGDFIIRADQARHLFVNTLFTREMFLEDTVTYDMTTWSIPQAYNLNATWTESSLRVNTSKVTEPLITPSGLENPNGSYAFVVDWKQANAPKALGMLWRKGYNVRSAERSFTKDGRTFSQGSLIVLVGRNFEKKSSLASDMREIAQSAEVNVVGFDTGRMDEGMDLASGSGTVIDQPKVALMIDRPFNSYTAGQLWFLFDQWTEFGISRIRTRSVGGIDLNQYDVILMPGAFGLNGALSENQINELKDWVRDGGTLVATENAAPFFTKSQSGFTNIELVTNADNDDKKKDDEVDPEAYTRYEDREDSSGVNRVPGSSFKSIIDNSHPLAFGLPDRLYSLKFSNTAIKPNANLNTVGHYVKDAGNLVASGYASQENKERVAGNAFAVHQSMGRGNVVLILDNTQYRMFWVGPARMIQNAVMQIPGY